MRMVTLDLDQLPECVLYDLAWKGKQKDLLEKLYEIGEERNNSGIFIELAKNYSPHNKDNIRKIAEKRYYGYEDYLAKNPFTPSEFLAEYVKHSVISDAIHHPNTPGEALDNCYPKIFMYRSYFIEKMLCVNGEKLSKNTLESIINYYRLNYPKYDPISKESHLQFLERQRSIDQILTIAEKLLKK